MSACSWRNKTQTSLIRRVRKTCALAAALFFSLATYSNAEQPADYSVKAAYIYSFLKFIDWPDDVLPQQSSKLKICSLGTSPLNSAVKGLHGRLIQRRLLDVVDVYPKDDLADCNVLVSGGAYTEQNTSILKRLDQHPVLTVGESPNFARDLGVIGFTIVDDRVKLEINLERAQAKNIKLSAQLLEVAERVYRQEGRP